ncbi:hypothetical protein EDB85DRAFT_2162814 [Lactarius pseudohatsudake]|nr:hypothetical protein EDB85DRAFT_2162814 [Lactarius pseudohatsudake]
MGMLRPEKSWRPIITLEVDGQHKHEVMLGVDGQNPNQRDIVLLHHAHHQTQLKLDVWHKSQSKAKRRKRRRLVASASLTLGDAIKKQGVEPYASSLTLLHVRRLSYLQTWSFAYPASPLQDENLRHNRASSAPLSSFAYNRHTSSGDKDPSNTLVTSGTDKYEDTPPWSSSISEEPPTGLRRRKKVKVAVRQKIKACDTWEPPTPSDESSDAYPDSFEIRTNTNSPSTISLSLIPTSYVDNISVTSGTGMSCASSTFDTLTYHRELREAQVTQLDSDFDRILGKLVQEWYYIGASRRLVAKRALIISSVASALALFVDVWFILAYSSADVHNFQTLAVDLYSSYFFFALSSRLPLVALSVAVAVLALVFFFGAIAWTAWPAAVLVMCVLAGVLISLQFIVYGSHRLALGLAWMARNAWLSVLYVWRRVRAVFVRGATAAAPPEREQQVDPLTVPMQHVVAPPAPAHVPGPAMNPFIVFVLDFELLDLVQFEYYSNQLNEFDQLFVHDDQLVYFVSPCLPPRLPQFRHLTLSHRPPPVSGNSATVDSVTFMRRTRATTMAHRSGNNNAAINCDDHFVMTATTLRR